MQATTDATRGIRLFLDTEFLSFKGTPRLLSIALTSDAGQFIYMELAADELQAIPSRRLNMFLKQQVLPQFGRIANAGMASNAMPGRLSGWLHSLNTDQAEVIYDYNVDFLLLEQLLEAMPTQPVLQLVPAHVGYALSDADGQAEAELEWQRIETALGLRRHHALADAMALAARLRVVHGNP